MCVDSVMLIGPQSDMLFYVLDDTYDFVTCMRKPLSVDLKDKDLIVEEAE